jgi:hypothetical protein
VAQAVSRLPLTAEAVPGSLYVRFVVDEVALGQVLFRALRFSSVDIIPPFICILIYHLEDEQ